VNEGKSKKEFKKIGGELKKKKKICEFG